MSSQERQHESKSAISDNKKSTDVDNAAELTQLVQQMLQQMQTRFGEMNNSIVSRIDDMGKKIDELESSIGELIQEASTENEGAAQQKH